MIQLNHGYRKRFITKLAGIATAADSTPTAILYRNGSASGTTVTVSTTAETGVYLATFTTDAGWAKTDHLELLVSATIDGDSGYKVVLWDSDGDVDAPMRGTDSANTVAPLDAAGTRAAVGLASANLDTQLGDIPTNAEFEARTLPSADYLTSLGANAPAGWINAAALADNAITAAKLADSAITSGKFAAGAFDAAAQVVIDHGDDVGLWGAVGSGGGGSIDTEQLIADIIEGLGAFSITRIGPEFNLATRTVTIYQGDDYLAANSNALTFAITLPGVDLTNASAVFAADSLYSSVLMGTATLIDTNTDNPKLRLEWSRAQTLAVAASDKLSWGVAIVDAGKKVQTIIGGPLRLKRALVNPGVTQAAIEA